MTALRVLAPAVRAVFGSTTAANSELRGTDALLRAPLPVSRRIAVVSLSGGSGCTATATVLAAVLAARRSGPVLAVDAAGGHNGLVGRLQPTPAADPDTAAPSGTGPTSLQQVRSEMPQTVSGASVLDLADARSDHGAEPGRDQAGVADWVRRVGPLARFFDLVVTDFGVRLESDDLAAAATTGQVVVLVARADAHHARAAARAARRLRAAGSGAVVLVLTDVARTPDQLRTVIRRIAGVPVQVLPHDRAWTTDRRPGAAFSSRSRWAHLRLAAAVMAAAVQAPPSPALRSPALAAPAVHATVSGATVLGAPTPGEATGSFADAAAVSV